MNVVDVTMVAIATFSAYVAWHSDRVASKIQAREIKIIAQEEALFAFYESIDGEVKRSEHIGHPENFTLFRRLVFSGHLVLSSASDENDPVYRKVSR